jgi:hypothetical protein
MKLRNLDGSARSLQAYQAGKKEEASKALEETIMMSKIDVK